MPRKPGGWRRVLLWGAGVFLVGFVALYAAARAGKLPEGGYVLLGTVILGPAEVLGVEPWRSELALYRVNCGSYRQPYPSLARCRSCTLETLFTCELRPEGREGLARPIKELYGR